MLVKSADDKSKRLTLLEDLQRSPLLDVRQKQWLRNELSRFRKGIQGERESAHYLDSYFKDGKNHVVLHDLRFLIDGDVAQIDHLVINRGFGMYLIETKNYSGSLTINEYGEFTAEYEDDSFGVPSPIEQSKRHERVLRKVMERVGIENRLGSSFEFHHVVLLHPKAIIKRPSSKALDTSNVIKADQFPTWHQRFVDKEIGVGKVLLGIANLRSLDTIKEWGEKLARQHRAANPLELPEFMQPRATPAPTARPAPAVRNPPAQRQSAPSQHPAQGVATQESRATDQAPAQPAPAKRLICAHCNSKISFAEGKFCWNNERRFSGLQYCREHQALF